MKSIATVTRQVALLLKENDFFIPLSGYISEEDFIEHNNVNTITIDSSGIRQYQENSDLSDEELDKQLIEFIKYNEPDTENITIVIEREIDFRNLSDDDTSDN